MKIKEELVDEAEALEEDDLDLSMELGKKKKKKKAKVGAGSVARGCRGPIILSPLPRLMTHPFTRRPRMRTLGWRPRRARRVWRAARPRQGSPGMGRTATTHTKSCWVSGGGGAFYVLALYRYRRPPPLSCE